MKIAIFHNYMDNIGGAEMVTLTLAKELNADIYSTNIDREKIEKMGFDNVNIISIGKIPLDAPFRQQSALWRFRKLNLKNKYDLYIITGDWAISGAVNNKPNIAYIHSPIREIWDSYKKVRKTIVPFHNRLIFDLWVLYNRCLNRRYINHVKKIVCNSANTKRRIKKYLNKDAKIIYPPIYTSKFYYKKNGDYWLSVNRLLAPKRVDMQVRAFKKLSNEKLIVVGSYEKEAAHFQRYVKYINKIKPENVEILHWVNLDKLIELYANCKGFIATANDEDFGMTLVEAMASGKPVIAANEGGYKESVIDGETGVLIDNINSDKLANAIKKIGQNPKKFKKACLQQAKKFDTSKFIKQIKQIR